LGVLMAIAGRTYGRSSAHHRARRLRHWAVTFLAMLSGPTVLAAPAIALLSSGQRTQARRDLSTGWATALQTRRTPTTASSSPQTPSSLPCNTYGSRASNACVQDGWIPPISLPPVREGRRLPRRRRAPPRRHPPKWCATSAPPSPATSTAPKSKPGPATPRKSAPARRLPRHLDRPTVGALSKPPRIPAAPRRAPPTCSKGVPSAFPRVATPSWSRSSATTSWPAGRWARANPTLPGHLLGARPGPARRARRVRVRRQTGTSTPTSRAGPLPPGHRRRHRLRRAHTRLRELYAEVARRERPPRRPGARRS